MALKPGLQCFTSLQVVKNLLRQWPIISRLISIWLKVLPLQTPPPLPTILGMVIMSCRSTSGLCHGGRASFLVLHRCSSSEYGFSHKLQFHLCCGQAPYIICNNLLGLYSSWSRSAMPKMNLQKVCFCCSTSTILSALGKASWTILIHLLQNLFR